MYSKLYVAVALALAQVAVEAASLNEVTERALARSPDVQARLSEFLSASQERDATTGALKPRVDLESYYGRERLDDNIGGAVKFNHPGVNLQLRQLLYDGNATRSEIRRAGHTKATRYYELLATTDDMALEAARAYLDVQRYRQLTQLAQDNWGVHKETYDQIEQRVKAGVGRRVDLEQAAGRVALAQSNWLTETSNLHDVGARFERVVGETPPVLVDAPKVTDKLPAEKEVILTSIQNNPNFMAAVSNLRAARAQTAVRRAANSPTFELRGSHSLERNHSGVPGHYSDTVGQVVMNYNIFRGGSDQARIRAAEQSFNAAVAQRDKSCRDLRQNAAIAWHDTGKLREQLQYLEQHVQATEKARDAYRQQFDIGQRSLLDVLDTENELFEARRALVRAQYDLKLSEFRVLAASHRLLPALGLASSNEATLESQNDENANDADVTCNTELPKYDALDTAAAMAGRTPRPIVVPPPPPAPAPVQTLSEQCAFAANDWAAAWSAKDLNKYLGYYSDNFQPLTRADRADWKRFRAERLNKPSISVNLEKLGVRQLSENSCEVSFNQSYRSSDYNDDVAKKLVLSREGKSWKIIREIAPKRASTN